MLTYVATAIQCYLLTSHNYVNHMIKEGTHNCYNAYKINPSHLIKTF